MTDIKLTERPAEVIVIDEMGNDQRFCEAARVSTRGAQSYGSGESEGLLRYLLTSKPAHTSPFEHGSLTVMVTVPIFVSRELVRHRTFSFNEVSGRYKQLDPVFYVPNLERPMRQEGKASSYTLETVDPSIALSTRRAIERVSTDAWQQYTRMLDDGVAREVARMVLPVNLMTSLYVTGNPLNWLRFFRLRSEETALYEIRELSWQIEGAFARRWPLTYEIWDKNGREL